MPGRPPTLEDSFFVGFRAQNHMLVGEAINAALVRKSTWTGSADVIELNVPEDDSEHDS